MPTPNPTIAVSAPGKVLLAGGYLVLDREFTGTVFGLSARINIVAQGIHTSEGVHLTEIVVESPQFLEAQWRYGYHLAEEGGGIKVTQLQVGSRINKNPFVETTLNFALTYIARAGKFRPSHSVKSARLTILADNDYYSHDGNGITSTPSSAASSSSATPPATPSRFAHFPTTLGNAHKTGLGSSAALVTSLSAALLTHYLPTSVFDLSSAAGKRVLHNLAQAAHCAAQGKVGSGFDVAAAVYGSCHYRRFSPAILSTLPEAGAPGFAAQLERVVEGTAPGAEWDTEVVKEAVRLPAGVAMRMCDVDCGSESVGMAKGVLAWRAKEPEKAREIWTALQARNERLEEVLREGRTSEIREAIHSVRELVREMGARSGVPIEPESQTELLDALETVEGVYGGVVPGAGGYDAAAILVRDDDATVKRIEEFLVKWSQEKLSKVKLMGVKGELEGARHEKLEVYQGWV
ncbi:ribosomal protein S5 domain 2-type protein [Podospora appendiculata]|uniref:Phosphomevalonate kinase n=1 Tax=Podospora appendiculata TaxID=314037 RepID=A0AAE1CC18_9PEZI|nr:ribosomal protein S5 domain 2-type protein [Podospora appendiculata]